MYQNPYYYPTSNMMTPYLTSREKPSLNLVQLEDVSYKLNIPDQVETKIRNWCAECPNEEWSGTLFYKVNGAFNDENFEITVVDFLVCDIGTSAFTSYEFGENSFGYMVDNDLMDCYCGLIHSHDSMAAFFSGTDVNTLKLEGAKTPHFLSLIVCNNGPYVARITKRCKNELVGVKNKSFISFNDTTIEDGSTEATGTEEFLEAYNLDINVTIGTTKKDETVSKLAKEIRKRKQEEAKEAAKRFDSNFEKFDSVPNRKFDYTGRTPSYKEPSLFNRWDEYEDDYKPNYNLNVDKYLARILTGDLFASAMDWKLLDKSRWIKEDMEDAFDMQFSITNGNTPDYTFEYYLSIIEETLPIDVIPSVYKQLTKLVAVFGCNVYISEIIDTLKALLEMFYYE